MCSSSDVKRLLDIVLIVLAAPFVLPLLALTSLAVLFALGRPVFFVQERAGRHGRTFRLVKFRTMREGAGTDAERLTRFGRFLRASSLDELPELWNIFRGDMSIVGPRPLLVEYLPYYTEEEKHRHDVRPGLTGLAQISGRNNLTWEQKFAYDLEYVQKLSWMFDIRIVLDTVKKVIRRADVQVDTQFSEGNLAKIRKATTEPERDATL